MNFTERERERDKDRKKQIGKFYFIFPIGHDREIRTMERRYRRMAIEMYRIYRKQYEKTTGSYNVHSRSRGER